MRRAECSTASFQSFAPVSRRAALFPCDTAADRETVLARLPGTLTPRPRRRGPRSTAALVRRSCDRASFSGSTPVDGNDGANPSKPRPSFPTTIFNDLGFAVYFINMRSTISVQKRALLSVELDKHRPDIVGLTETWLDDSIEFLDIPGWLQGGLETRPQEREE